MKRFAFVRNGESEKRINAYIDGTDYNIIGRIDGSFIIAGEDVAGWGLDTYVIPRLGSGMIWAEEITEDNPIFERNQGVIWFGDSVVLANVVDVDTVILTSFADYDPAVNGITVEFRIWLKFDRNLEKFRIEHTSIQRTDHMTSVPRLSATDSQRRKVYDFALDMVKNLPARVILAGQVEGIEQEIRSEEKMVERLMKDVADHKKTIHNLGIHLDTALKTPVPTS